MNQEELKKLTEEVGKQAAEEIKKVSEAAEQKINAQIESVKTGSMTKAEFEEYKKEALSEVNATLKKLEDVSKEQGNKINTLIANPQSAQRKSFEDFIIEQAPTIKKLKEEGKMMEITATQLKAAGVTSIGNSIQDMTSPPGSPYAPGINNQLEIFDIMRNPNYVLNQVDMGRTDQSRLAWANETDYQGAPDEVTEGGSKPLTQHKFQVELSTAKKMAAYINITDEFDQDLPAFATQVRRMLQEDVFRGWDSAVQAALITSAKSFEITDLNGLVPNAQYWSALRAMWAQVASYNFVPNSIGINPITGVLLDESKTTQGEYLIPPYFQSFRNVITEANKVAVGNAFVGDLKQFKVDVYKEFVLKMGWINDDLIKNQFTIVGEVRYHRYISDARKKAICYDTLATVQNLIKTV